MKNDEANPDWLSAIDDETAMDAERMKALLDLGLRDLLWLAMVKDHRGAVRFLERVAWDLHCPVAFMEYLCRKLSIIGYGGGWMGTKVADSVDVLCLVGSKKFQDAFLVELEKERGKNGK